MLGRLRGDTKRGWMVVSFGSDRLRYVSCGGEGAGQKPRLHACGELAVEADARRFRKSVHREGISRRRKCVSLLESHEYTMHLVDAPDVPPAELKAAMKWRLKDVLEFTPEECTYDVLDVPPVAARQKHNVYVIAARRDPLKRQIERLDAAGLNVDVIDIPETAQRNIAVLYEQDERGLCLLNFDDTGGLMTINYRGDLYLTRRLEVTRSQLQAEGEGREDQFNRVLLEVQRTLDNFERQFSFVTLDRLLFGPEPADTGLENYLSANLGIRVEAVNLNDVLDVAEGVVLDARAQAAFFHLIGSSLRTEAVAG